MGLQLTGLASGLDWKSVVDQLIAAEATPITTLQTEQDTNTEKKDALSTLQTKMQALQVASDALNSTDLYSARSIASSSSTSGWSLSAAASATTGSYKIAVSQLATAAKLNGGNNAGQALSSTSSVSTSIADLRTGTAITAGTFTVNGKTISVELTDSLDTVLGKITTATGVNASYDPTNDTVKLSSGSKIVLGASNDSSNILSALRLTNNGTGAIESSSALGTVAASATLENAQLSTALDDPNGDGSGSFTINGVQIDYNFKSESLNSIISKINGSSAGVTASYDTANDRVVLTNNTTGDLGFSVEDVSGNLMSALKLAGPYSDDGDLSQASIDAGKNALFTINGGATLTSTSNTLDSTVTGLTGVSITVNSETTETVTIGKDTSSLKTKIDDFISKYNDVQDYIEEKTKISVDGTSVTTGTLANDSQVAEYASKLRKLMFSNSSASGSINRLYDMGIDFVSGSNKLEIKDSTKLTSALSSSASDVMNFFTNSSTGFVTNLDSYFTSVLGTDTKDGSIETQITNLTKANEKIDDQIADKQRWLETERSRLEDSFIRMEEAQQTTNNLLLQISKSFYS